MHVLAKRSAAKAAGQILFLQVVASPYQCMHLLRQSKAEPADQLLYDLYKAAVNAILTMRVPRTRLPHIPYMCTYGQQITASAAGACMHVACA